MCPLRGPNWIQHLPWVMLGIRATPREDTDITPAQAVFGSSLVLPGQIATDPETSLDNFMSTIKATLSRSKNLSAQHNTAAAWIHPTELPAALLDTSHVLVCWDSHLLPLAPLFDSPYTVLRRGAQYFTIQMGAKEEVVSTSRLKPCHMPKVAPMLPRRWGWLPRSAGQLGLPPQCPVDHPCTPLTLLRIGEGAAPHGWPPPLSPRWGGSGGHQLATSLPTVEAPPAPSLPTVEAPTSTSLPTVEAPASPSLPTVEAPPSILAQPGWPPCPARRVHFQDQRKEPSPPAPCSQSETVSPAHLLGF